MTCPAWQRLLDDNPRGLPAGQLRDHVAGCRACAGRAELFDFNRALPHFIPPEPPPGLAGVITAAVLDERHRRHARPRRWVPVAALAAVAALLLAVGLGVWRPGPPRPAVVRGPSLRDTATRAEKAGRRLLDNTVGTAASLLPQVERPIMGPMPEPALRPLRDTADGVTVGLAPVTDSARRAVHVFFRDMPLGLKPG